MIFQFTEYLTNIKCYSNNTILIYKKYINELNRYDNDYRKLLKKYASTSNNTKRVILSAIKLYYQYIDDKRYKDIELPKKEKKVLDYITYQEYNEIINYLENKKTPKLDNILIVKFLYETGIRSSELLNIKRKDINDNQIIIHGKGNKQRIIYVSDKLLKLINKYIKIKKIQDNQKLFNFKYKCLYKKIRLMGKVIDKKITPHMFRRGFATYCIDNNIGIYEVSLMLGHENINTTKTYLRNDYKISIMKNIFN